LNLGPPYCQESALALEICPHPFYFYVYCETPFC
jgi:hypothetical protein